MHLYRMNGRRIIEGILIKLFWEIADVWRKLHVSGKVFQVMSIWLKKESLLNNEVCTKASGGGGEIPTDTGEELQVEPATKPM